MAGHMHAIEYADVNTWTPLINTKFPVPITDQAADLFEQRIRTERIRTQQGAAPLPGLPDNFDELLIPRKILKRGFRCPVIPNQPPVTDGQLQQAFAILIDLHPRMAQEMTKRYLEIQSVLDRPVPRLKRNGERITEGFVSRYVPGDWFHPDTGFSPEVVFLPHVYTQMLRAFERADGVGGPFRTFGHLYPGAVQPSAFPPPRNPRDLSHWLFGANVGCLFSFLFFWW
ncbi:hypothetical protein QBC41DRAFT_221974 [Cercophora samala]|uniref:Uncharacterized protein n=1 Tax=Cercophora samala TaxID=330535 RepID=A0AA39ZFV1_9PEZI|nr:hypothetical protein QBC41DRAFT_221974 [Cercophora samala]